MNDKQLDKIKNIHIVGIEGAGTSALALVLSSQGKLVGGSDEGDHFYYDVLQKAGIRVNHVFAPENINEKIELVIHSTAHSKEKNPELKRALEIGLPVISYAEALAQIFNQKFGIAVCGTHGKTTTTAMLALAMRAAGVETSVVVGSKVPQLDLKINSGDAKYFVIEADEYQNKLALYAPWGVVLTSADFDHPDFFPNHENYKQVFKDFVAKIPRHGFLVAWGGSADVVEIAKFSSCRLVFYGDFSSQAKERLLDEMKAAGKENIELFSLPVELELKIPGKHNLLNATAVLAVDRLLKLDSEKIKESLEQFEGTARRFEILGSRSGATIVDDYAHHPQEIRATLRAAREKYTSRNIICVFHPHTFSRTKALMDEFSQSFNDADRVIVLDIYPSAREQAGDVHSSDLVQKIKKYKLRAEYVPDMDKAFDALKDELGPRDVLITMGAGDVYKLGKKLIAKDEIK